MNILVLGGGAREHSICWALSKSKKCSKIFCSPGNAGIQKIAICPKIDIKKNEVFKFCKKNQINLVVIGPEQFLADGFSDYLLRRGINTFGPVREAAKLETSKSFAKSFLINNNIATPNYKVFRSYQNAVNHLKKVKFPIVIKADGLASGKGVIICDSEKNAISTLYNIIKKNQFGEAGKKIIIEEFIEGFEISFFAFIDKKSYLPLGYALDHKKAFDNDKGPNTGGMGCFTPSRLMTKNLEKKIIKDIVGKTFTGLKKEKFVYRGILFFGLIVKKNKPYIIEFNVRFGDPECQTLLRNLKSDILTLFLSTTQDQLKQTVIKSSKNSVVCVVLASKGYPGSYVNNKIIKNLDKIDKKKEIEIFHAGTKLLRSNFVSNGGRVLSITATGANLNIARTRAYKAVDIINWKNGFYRNDIGIKNK